MKLSKFFTKTLLTLLFCSFLTPTTSSATFWSQWSKKQTIFAITSATIGISGLMYLLYSHYTKNEMLKKLFCYCQQRLTTDLGYNDIMGFINYGIDINKADIFGKTPLFYACKNGHNKIATLLFENSTHQDLSTAFSIASETNNPEIANVVLKHNANNNGNLNVTLLLQDACYNDKFTLATVLLTYNANLDALSDQHKKNLLQHALFNKNNDLATKLIQHKTPINDTVNIMDNDYGYERTTTFLHAVCKKGYYEMAKLLITHGAHINALDVSNNTPLHDSCEKGHLNIVKLLIEHSAQHSLLNKAKQPPVYYACLNNHHEIATYLTQNGAIIPTEIQFVIITLFGDYVATLLHYACLKGYYEIANLLINKGANVNALSCTRQRTPLQDAYQNNHDNIAKLLIKHGATISGKKT